MPVCGYARENVRGVRGSVPPVGVGSAADTCVWTSSQYRSDAHPTRAMAKKKKSAAAKPAAKK